MRTETLKVGGMTCGGCVGAVTNALRADDGVEDVVVSLKPSEARIEFDERATSPERLREAVKQAGYEVNVAGSESQAKRGCCS
jgi:copper chaperone